MSKILKNQTVSPISISDVGISLPASPTTYTIQPQDYLLWAASSDIITEIGSGNVIVNDGSSDLSISDGVDLIKGLFPKKVSISQSVDGAVKIDVQKTAFGELQVSQLNPYINLKCTKGQISKFTEAFTSGTGSFAGVHDHEPGREFEAECGTTTGGFGVIRSKKALEYKGGIGSLARFTAKFSVPRASTTMRAGLQNIGNELAFGYNGTTFGILYRTGGRPEIRTLTLTQRATNSQTATITLNGVAFTAAVTNSSIEQNAYEIATNGVFTGWNAYSVGSTVVFQARTTGAKTGTYSLTSTGNLAGSFARTAAGLTEVDNWINQADWNGTTLLTENDPFILDHTKGNVFQIQFQYLGFGAIKFFIENPDTGKFTLVHTIKYANANTSPSLDIPTFKIGLISYNLGSANSVTVSSASMACFSENFLDFPGKIYSQIASASGIGTTLTNLITFKKVPFSDNLLNISDIIGSQASFASEATNPVVLELRINATLTGVLKWKYTSVLTPIIYEDTQSTVSGGDVVYSIALSKSSNTIIDLSKLDIVLSNDDTLTFAVKATNGTVSASGSFIWGEQ